MAPRFFALALALRGGCCLKPPRLRFKLPTTQRGVATLEPPPLEVDTEPRINLREVSPLTVDAACLTTTQQLDGTPATRQLDESNETPTHWRRAAHIQRSLMRFAPLTLVGALLAVPKTLDAGVSTLWAKLYGTWWAHAPMFEAWTATLGFVGAIAFWSSIHVLFFRDRRRASEFRFDKQPPVAPFEWLGQLGGKRLWGAYLPLVAYVGSIKLFHCVVTKAPLPIAPPTALRVLLEVTCGVYLSVWKSTSVSGAVFTKSCLGNDVAARVPSSGKESTPPRHRAGVASMAWRSTWRFTTNAP